MGKFIVFEGVDRSGKSTNSQFAYDYLVEKGYAVCMLREPGGAKLSEKIRELLLSGEFDIVSQAELLLFLAARSQFVEEVVKPALKQYDYVLCDRFNMSTFAYQGYGRGLDVEKIIELDAFARNGFSPDALLYFQIDLATFNARARESFDRIESEGDSFFVKVMKGYDELAKKMDNCYTLNSKVNLEAVQQNVIEILEEIC